MIVNANHSPVARGLVPRLGCRCGGQAPALQPRVPSSNLNLPGACWRLFRIDRRLLPRACSG